MSNERKEIRFRVNRYAANDLSRIAKLLTHDFIVVMASKNECSAKENWHRLYDLADVIEGEKWKFVPLVGYYIENGKEVEELALLFYHCECWSKEKKDMFKTDSLLELTDKMVDIAEQKCYLKVCSGRASLVYADKYFVDVGSVNIESQQRPNYMSILAKGNGLIRNYTD